MVNISLVNISCASRALKGRCKRDDGDCSAFIRVRFIVLLLCRLILAGAFCRWCWCWCCEENDLKREVVLSMEETEEAEAEAEEEKPEALEELKGDTVLSLRWTDHRRASTAEDTAMS